MNDSILCPHCSKPIPLTQAITAQTHEKNQAALEELKKAQVAELARYAEHAKKRIEEERLKAQKEAEVKAREKVRAELETKLKDTQNESEELKAKNKKQQDELISMMKDIRAIKESQEAQKVEMERKLMQEEEKMKETISKKKDEEYRLKMLEQEKKIQDAMKMAEEYKRKMEQGSQQMQGEVLELAIEELLKKEFPTDEILPVPKGVTGADIIQKVLSSGGVVAGTIIWEMKRTKSWSHQWIPKLKDDQRTMKAEIAIIISEIVPDTVSHFGLVEGVWVCKFDYITAVAHAIRVQLLELSRLKNTMVGQQGKMDILYNYITSVEFKHRVEAILEGFSNMQSEIEKERRWFAQKWAREEKNLRKVLDTTIGMHGDLQSIMGKSIADLKELDALPPGDTVE